MYPPLLRAQKYARAPTSMLQNRPAMTKLGEQTSHQSSHLLAAELQAGRTNHTAKKYLNPEHEQLSYSPKRCLHPQSDTPRLPRDRAKVMVYPTLSQSHECSHHLLGVSYPFAQGLLVTPALPLYEPECPRHWRREALPALQSQSSGWPQWAQNCLVLRCFTFPRSGETSPCKRITPRSSDKRRRKALRAPTTSDTPFAAQFMSAFPRRKRYV